MIFLLVTCEVLDENGMSLFLFECGVNDAGHERSVRTELRAHSGVTPFVRTASTQVSGALEGACPQGDETPPFQHRKVAGGDHWLLPTFPEACSRPV